MRSMCRVLIKKTRPQCMTKTVNPHVRLTQTVPEQVPRRRSSDSEGATAARIEPKPWNNEHMAAGGRRRRSATLSNLVHKCLNGRAPGYLADDFRLAGRGRPGSQSAASMMLDIPRTTTSLGDRAFAVAGPRVWNSLPPAIRDPSLSSIFGKLLKTYLFV